MRVNDISYRKSGNAKSTWGGRKIKINRGNPHSESLAEIDGRLGRRIGYIALIGSSILGAVSCGYGVLVGLDTGLSAWEWLTVPTMGVVAMFIAILLWLTGDRHIRPLSIFVILWVSFYLISNLANAIHVVGDLPTAFIYLAWFPVLFAFIGALITGRAGLFLTWFLFVVVAVILLSAAWLQPAVVTAGPLFNAALVNLMAMGAFIAMLYAVAAYRSRFAAAAARAQAVVESTAKLQEISYRDALTGLPNRKLLHERLTQLLANNGREGIGLAVHLLNVDRFQEINETLGHGNGDRVLVRLAERLQVNLRMGDTLARTAGDEFVVIEQGSSDPEQSQQLAERLLAAVAAPLEIADRRLRLSISIGTTVWTPWAIRAHPVDLATVEETLKVPNGDRLLHEAEAAMRSVKQSGGHGWHLFQAGMSVGSDRRLALRTGLWRALEYGEFRLRYQPQVDLNSGRLVGAEALIRWQDPEHGLRGPVEFISIAEESGAIVGIGEWVIREACRAAAAWPSTTARIEVNVSPLQIERGDLLQVVEQALKESGLPPQRLGLELTESVFVRTSDTRFQQVFADLRALGVGLVVDDFGTGYSSLLYLKHFPITMLKIDRAFVAGMDTDSTDYAIVKAIITFARAMGVELLAEGIETEAQRSILVKEGCRLGQGFLFDKPLTGSELHHHYFSSSLLCRDFS